MAKALKIVAFVVLTLLGASEGVTSGTASLVHTVAFWGTLMSWE